MSHLTAEPSRRGLRLPLPDWLLHYQKGWLGADAVGGLIAAAIVIPKALAYASIAGLPVEVGLYTVVAAMLFYAMLGSSPVLSVSTTTTIAILVAGEIGPIAKKERG